MKERELKKCRRCDPAAPTEAYLQECHKVSARLDTAPLLFLPASSTVLALVEPTRSRSAPSPLLRLCPNPVVYGV